MQTKITSNRKQILRLKEVKTSIGLSRSTIYQHIRLGLFPKSIKLGPRCIGWLEGDINDWINSRVRWLG